MNRILCIITATVSKIFESAYPKQEKHKWMWYYKTHLEQLGASGE